MRKSICSLTLVLMMVSVKAQNGSPYWSLSGNSNATVNSKLGTINYTALNLNTNNVPRIYIAPNGFIGIGTTSPTTQLHVEGQTLLNIFVNTNAPGTQSGSGLIGYVKGMPTAAGQRLGYFLTGSQGGGTDPYNATGMVGYADGAWTDASRPAYIAFETTKTGSKTRSEAMRITSAGTIGINTTNTAGRLHSADSVIAIYGQGLGPDSYGVSASGGFTGVNSQGMNFGVYSIGSNTGVYGSGFSYGIWGNGTTTGVRGVGYYGLYGESSQDLGDGVYAQGTGTSGYGADFYSQSSLGVYARTGATNSYAGYFQGKVYTSASYVSSDRKLKKNIAEFTDASAIIKKLKPKTYEYQTEGRMAEMNLPKGKQYGLIAQDLEEVLPNLVSETPQYPRRDTTAGPGKRSTGGAAQETFKAVNYTALIPIIIKGMQEQEEKMQNQDDKLQEQDEVIQELKATVAELKAMLTNNTTGSLSSATLEVPVPNPAKGSTNIRYSIPAGIVSARLTVVNMLGQVIKEMKLSGGGGQVSLNVSNLASGTYPCTLWVNGQPTVSKQLIVVKN